MFIKKTGKILMLSLLAASILVPVSVSAASTATNNDYTKLKEDFSARYKNKLNISPDNSLKSVNFGMKFNRLAANDENQIIETEPNDYIESAERLPLNAYGLGMLSGYDIDVWRIDLPRDGKVMAAIASGYNGVYGTDAVLVLSDSADTAIYPMDMTQDEETGAKGFVFELEAGTYYIHAFDYNQSYESGTYAVTTAYVDNSGDTTPPSRPRVNKVDDNDRVITGIAEANSNIGVFVNGELYAANYANASGKFSVAIKPIKAGSRVEVFAMDASDNVSAPAGLFVADKTPPGLAVNKVLTKHKVITGKTERGSTVVLKQKNKVVGKGKVDSRGNFKIAIKAQKSGTKFDVATTDKYKNERKVTITVMKK
ncbi:hypothetical protein J9317_02015 [Metabacillus sp. KIGAM252]|uniref:Bacterial Ig domain-containing protein n=1 Tax=Metabacillus flavus TaxID=2823519 RepID=A0ABS5LAH8_9BACI|nr:Ig-like domain-containing protein [Metabacillus flavus]MBS2967548.1 hypothetical protein [Metabacillus flavus]